MAPEEQAALEWYGNLIITEVLMSSSALRHQQWHESRGEA